MNNRYYLLATALLGLAAPAAAQRPWQPFRPGMVYTYHAVPAVANDPHYTLRVDSAYVAPGGDSVYVFNRLMRNRYAGTGIGTGPFYFYKSRNNQFGKQVRWQPGQRGFTLEATPETGLQSLRTLELRPQAAVGSTWATGGGTATLVSRGWQAIDANVQDTVAVISLSGAGGAAQTVRVSRLHGLLAAPQWLGAAVGTPATVVLEQAALPVRYAQSAYNPLNFFDVQPGDEFGYQEDDMMLNGFSCWTRYLLRRILSRQQTADSLIIRYAEQMSTDRLAGGPCGTGAAGTTVWPATTSRWAVALGGNALEPAAGASQLGLLRLLTYEYAYTSVTSSWTGQLVMGQPLGVVTNPFCVGSTRNISYAALYGQSNGQYSYGFDYGAWQYDFTQGLTRSREKGYRQTYARRTVGGQPILCGSSARFAGLLPTRAAQAAAVFSLRPNPAAEAAILALRTPATAGTAVRLRDALGRLVWVGSLAAGQREATVPLAGLPAGVYLVQLAAPGDAPLSLRLVKE